MKKILFLFVVLIFSFKFNNVNSYDEVNFFIDWQNIYVDIPLGSSITDYQDNFRVCVFIDGKEIDKSEYYCVVGINGTSLTTVNTNKVGKYSIDVMVTIYKYNASSENTIIYNVIDYESPELSFTDTSINTKYNVKPDYQSILNASDNSGEIASIVVHDSHVDYSQIGIYEIEIDVTDPSKNTTTLYLDLYIVDNIKPRISLVKPLEISLGQTINAEDFFIGYDDYEKNITNRIKFETYDNTKLGIQYIYVSLTDLSGNTMRSQFELSIVDNLAPEILFNTNDVKIDIEERLTYDLFRSFILEVSDNNSYLTIEDVKIDFTTVLNELGSYNVTYTLEDEHGNILEKTLVVRVIQTKGPEITCIDVIINKGESLQESIIKNYITIYDPYDSTAASSLKVDFGSVNLNEAGTYLILVSACNSSGVFTYETLRIIVLDSNQFNLSKYWPLLLIALAPLGYLGFQKYNKFKANKYQS